MNLFKDKHTVVVYLSKNACREYTVEMINQYLKDQQMTLLVSSFGVEAFENFRVVEIDSAHSRFDYVRRYFSIKSKLLSKLDKINVIGKTQVYLPTFHPLNSVVIDWAKKRGLTTLLTIHDYYTHQGEQSQIIEWIQRQQIKKTSGLIALSSYVADQIKLDYPDKRIELIPHPSIDIGILNAPPKNQLPSILFLGRVVHYKGIDLLLEAIKPLDISKCTIAGQGRINKASDPRMIIENKYLSLAEIGSLLQSHHVLVLPYKEATQSGILAMALPTGISIVVTDVGGLGEQVAQTMRQVYWVKPEVESIQSGIVTAIQNL